jgi:Amt family ammonium transporter
MFIWTTLVYDPVAYWTWGARGWIKNMSCLNTLQCAVGGIDFAGIVYLVTLGGGPVHIASGFSALAYAYMLGKREKTIVPHPPHHITNVFIGTALLWYL